MSKLSIVAAAVIAMTIAGCEKPAPQASEARPVRTISVERGAEGETTSLTGHIRAKDQVDLAFRLDGRMIERPVHVGDLVTAGQVVARLDPQNQQNSLRSAQADLASAEAVLTQATLTFGRQQKLLADGWTTHARFDDAQQALVTAQAQVDSAQAHVRIAQDQLSYTALFADAPGAVTAVGAESGEVVRAGQMVVQLARQGGRDAVFDVPEELIRTGPRDPMVEIALTDDPQVKATGRVREVAPQADPATRTFQALRIAVNQELEELEALLAALPEVIEPGGVATVLSFHSLEDRLAKRAFLDHDTWSPLWKKPMTASDEECTTNPRARSAKLRAATRR